MTDERGSESLERVGQEPWQSDLLLRLALEGAQLGTWDFDPVTGRSTWDPRTRRLFGVGPDEEIDFERFLREMVHPEDRERLVETFQRALDPAGDGRYEIDYRVFRVDGGVRWLSVRGRTFFTGEGPERRAVRVLGTVQDVTERLRAEQALRESEQRFRLATEAMNGLVYEWDMATNEIQRSPGMLHIVGFSPEEVPPDARWWREQIHPDDLPMTDRAFAVAVAECAPAVSTEYRVRHRDGSYAWVWDSCRIVYDKTGQPVRLLGCTVSIDARKRAEEALRESARENVALSERLREADRRKDEFLATLAHELRNPLAPILNSLNILKIAEGDPRASSRAREVMERQLGHMVRLIDDLLDVSRITRNRLELRPQRIELAEVLQSALETSRPRIDAQGHHLTVALPPDRLELRADPTRLAQVFVNLFHNAAKYTPRGGHIWLIAERLGNEVVVKVRDNGIGIAPAQLASIFDLFMQEDRSLQRAQGGLGIGLTLVKWLTEMHDGRVEARSDGPGQGTEVLVVLPLLDPATEAHPPGTAA